MAIELVPRHLGIIMDGNRRFSKRLLLKPWKGHEWGARKVGKVLMWCKSFDIKELTLYTFSIQNFDRPKREFEFLMKIFRENFEELKNERALFDYKIRINVIGRLWMFPESVQKSLYEIMDLTKNNDRFIINFAMAYGGREEVIDATKKIAERVKKGELDIKDINEEVFRDSLYLNSEPDLIIRTGGEKRLSNFLPFQSTYTEFIFSEKMWPEFDSADFLECIEEYSNRKRRYGR